jgi:hypothetical protein
VPKIEKAGFATWQTHFADKLLADCTFGALNDPGPPFLFDRRNQTNRSQHIADMQRF